MRSPRQPSFLLSAFSMPPTSLRSAHHKVPDVGALGESTDNMTEESKCARFSATEYRETRQLVLHETRKATDVFLLQAIVRGHETLARCHQRPEARNRENKDWSIAGQFLRAALFSWIRNDMERIEPALISAAWHYVRLGDEPEFVQHIIRCIRVSNHFKPDPRSMWMIRNVYNTKANHVFRRRGGSSKKHVRTIHYLWKAFDITFANWPPNGNVVGTSSLREMICDIIENCMILCRCCQHLQQHEDALSHATRCIEFLNQNEQVVAWRLPRFLQLVAFAAVLRSDLEPDKVDLAEQDVKRAMNVVSELEIVHSVEGAFLMDAATRILMKSYHGYPGDRVAALILGYQENADALWSNLTGPDQNFFRERASSYVLLADWKLKFKADCTGAIKNYQKAMYLCCRGSVELDLIIDQIASIQRRIEKLTKDPDSPPTDDMEQRKVDVQDLSLWGLSPHVSEEVRCVRFEKT